MSSVRKHSGLQRPGNTPCPETAVPDCGLGCSGDAVPSLTGLGRWEEQAVYADFPGSLNEVLPSYGRS